MSKVVFAVLVFALVGVVAVPTAAGEQFHANVVSWRPNDVQPGEPVSLVLQFYTLGPSPYPKEGPASSVNDVEVVIRGEGQTRRFATEELGSGRYRAEIVFPKAGGWHLRVSYGAGGYGSGDVIVLGKGGLCVGGERCVVRDPEERVPAHGDGRPWTALVLLVVALAAAAVIRFGVFGRQGRVAHTA